MLQIPTCAFSRHFIRKVNWLFVFFLFLIGPKVSLKLITRLRKSLNLTESRGFLYLSKCLLII